MFLKKLLKISIITISVLILIIIGILLATLRKVDKTPYFQTEYYSATVDQLNKALEEKKEVSGYESHEVCYNPCTDCSKKGYLDNGEICPVSNNDRIWNDTRTLIT